MKSMNMSHHHYDHYTAAQINRLDGFYGMVEKNLHEDLLPYISGKRILDVGCGFGSLCHFFSEKGFDVTGIEQHKISFDAAKRKFPQLNLIFDEGNFLNQISDESFDVITMKDVIHHVVAEADIDVFMKNLYRICKKQVVIVDPNPMFILKVSRKLINHIDPECPPQLALKILEKYGFSLTHFFYREVIAFPLSGGYVGPELIKSPFLMRAILNLDVFINSVLKALRLSSFFCWRYVLVFEKK